MKASFLSTVALSALVLTGAVIATTAPSHAAIIVQTIGGNDCGNSKCVANESGTGETRDGATGSPFIAKINPDGQFDGDDGVNPLFPSIELSDFVVDFANNRFMYTPDDDTDPAIRFWVAKGGPNYNLFYEDTDGDDLADPIAEDTWYSFYTPTNPNNNKPYGLSHLTFFDTQDPPNEVPEPATLALFGMGLLGLGMASRRRKSK